MKGKVLQPAAPTATATAILVAHLMFVFLNASAPTSLRETVRLAVVEIVAGILNVPAMDDIYR
tara:strand:+ start:671 stop:859 length:189 start_codon:yes stop_codon:yes gene_type:complete